MKDLVFNTTFVEDSTIGIDPDLVHQELSDILPCEEFRNNYLLTELLSKLPRDGIPASVRAENAIVKMLESEDVCRSINNDGYRCNTPRDFFSNILLIAQTVVAEVLGDFSYDLYERASFSSGATVCRTRKFGDPFYKYSRKPVSVTSGCQKYAEALIRLTPLWDEMDVAKAMTIVAGNSITTVPKKTDIDRCIAKEPAMNMALQRALGSHIRSRLKRRGIDLDDQSVNQRLAHKGSVDGSVATIDLASASDTISDRVVWDLLPQQWYEELNKLRSHYGTLPNGRLIKWEKFSSMGNGFTFELESLIFYAVAYATVRVSGDNPRELSVYGDDIIVPTKSARALISVLSDLGFSTNVDKSFLSGPFRESCGKHYHKGVDVTPFYIRKPIVGVARIIWFLNSLRKWCTIVGIGCDPRVFRLWNTYKRRLVPRFLYGGNSFEDPGSLVTPEAPRYRLTPILRMKRIDGPRAILRYFQFTENGVWKPFSSPYSRERVFHFGVSSWSHLDLHELEWKFLPMQVPSKYRIASNDGAMWWPIPGLFPQEVGEIT